MYWPVQNNLLHTLNPETDIGGGAGFIDIFLVTNNLAGQIPTYAGQVIYEGKGAGNTTSWNTAYVNQLVLYAHTVLPVGGMVYLILAKGRSVAFFQYTRQAVAPDISQQIWADGFGVIAFRPSSLVAVDNAYVYDIINDQLRIDAILNFMVATPGHN